jgi:tetratricopeptide (TPR) repeat protein
MFQKAITLLVSFILVFAAAGCGNSKYNPDLSHMPKELRQKHTENIQKLQADLKSYEDGDPREAKTLVSLGFEYGSLGKYKKALKYYKKALNLEPFNYAALNNAADIYKEVGEYRVASEYYDTIYDNFAPTPQIITNIVDILLRNGRTDDAKRVVEDYAIEMKENGAPLSNEFLSSLFSNIEEAKGKVTSE